MPYTIYAKIIKQNKKKGHKITNRPIYTIQQEPLDYPDLKDTLTEAAIHIHLDHNQTTTEITLWKHHPGKYKTATKQYRKTRTRIGKTLIIAATLTYTPKTMELEINKLSFATSEAYYKYAQGYYTDKNKKFTLPKTLVPTSFQAILNSTNPDIYYTQLLTMKTPTFKPLEKKPYGNPKEQNHTQGMYAGVLHGSYAARDYSTFEQQQIEKQNKA